jgi:arsenate reductase (thioredoxin)
VPPAFGKPVRVLFVCLGNACRSQMAEALARHIASDVMIAASAGITALGIVPDETKQVLAARGVEMDGQFSKPLRAELKDWAEVIINISGVPGGSAFSDVPHKVEDWDISDPFGKDLAMYEMICDEVESRVSDLARRLRQMQAQQKPA